MRFDQHPVFRDRIIPWYDTNTVCFIVMAIMTLVFIFGGTGAAVALESAAYHRYLWLPLLLMTLSGTVIVSTAIRLILRRG